MPAWNGSALKVLVLNAGCPYSHHMVGASRGRDQLIKVLTRSVGRCWIVLTLSGCGDDGTAPPGGVAEADAATADTVQPGPVDAAVPASGDAHAGSTDPTTRASARPSGFPPAPTLVPTVPVALTTAASTLPVPSASASADLYPWVDVESPLADQSDCRESLTGTGTQRFYQLECDPDKLWVSCALEDGAVACACANETTGEAHEFMLPPETDIEVASRASISLCNGANAPEFSEPACDDVNESSLYGCYLDRLCTRSVELPLGAQAYQQTSPSQIECSEQTDAKSWCRCSSHNGGLAVRGVDIADACAALAPWCASEMTFSDTITCEDPVFVVGPETCSTSRECGFRANLNEAGDVFVVDSAMTHGTFCSWNGEDSSSCSCDSARGTILNGTVETSLEEACVIMYSFCDAGLPAQPSGVIECGLESVQAAGETCTGSASCSQEFSNGGGDSLLASATVNSTCEADGNGGWTCVCNGGGADSQPEAVSAPTGIRACSTAIDTCVTGGRLEVGEAGFVLVVFSETSGPVDGGAPAPVDAAVSGDL